MVMSQLVANTSYGGYVDMRKRNKVIIASILIIFTLKYIVNSEHLIGAFVYMNNEELEVIAEEYLNSDTGIESYKGIRVAGVFRGENDIVEFDFWGIGLVPSTTYYGFYYSPDDVPAVFQNAPTSVAVLSPVTDEEWEWSEENTDNGGRTIRIMKNWFYYEASF